MKFVLSDDHAKMIISKYIGDEILMGQPVRVLRIKQDLKDNLEVDVENCAEMEARLKAEIEEV